MNKQLPTPKKIWIWEKLFFTWCRQSLYAYKSFILFASKHITDVPFPFAFTVIFLKKSVFLSLISNYKSVLQWANNTECNDFHPCNNIYIILEYSFYLHPVRYFFIGIFLIVRRIEGGNIVEVIKSLYRQQLHWNTKTKYSRVIWRFCKSVLYLYWLRLSLVKSTDRF